MMSFPPISLTPDPDSTDLVNPSCSPSRLVLAQLAVMLALFTCFFPSPALAHSRLLTSQPQSGEELTQPPREVILEFNTPIEPAFGRIELRQQQWQALNITVHGKTMRAALPRLPPGQHQLRWSIMSSDGHHQTGILRFSIQP